MTRNSFVAGLPKANQDIYYYAVEHNTWISYKKKWYTPSEFIRDLAPWEINVAHIRCECPLSVLKQGREIFYNIVKDGKPKEEILEALKRLNVFTDKVINQYEPSDK